MPELALLTTQSIAPMNHQYWIAKSTTKNATNNKIFFIVLLYRPTHWSIQFIGVVDQLATTSKGNTDTWCFCGLVHLNARNAIAVVVQTINVLI